MRQLRSEGQYYQQKSDILENALKSMTEIADTNDFNVACRLKRAYKLRFFECRECHALIDWDIADCGGASEGACFCWHCGSEVDNNGNCVTGTLFDKSEFDC